MSEGPINMHKRLAMGQPGAETHLKKGGSVKKYAAGGAVNKGAVPESRVAKLPAKGTVAPLPKPTGKIATMRKGGAARGR